MSYIDNLEKVPDLEDPKLVKHIDEIRSLFNKYNLNINNNPQEVIDNDKSIRTDLSNMIIDFRKQIETIKLINDQIYTYKTDTLTLSNGIKPYMYIECDTATDIFKKISFFLNNTSEEIEEYIKNIEKMECEITKIRRLYESILSNIYDNIKDV